MSDLCFIVLILWSFIPSSYSVSRSKFDRLDKGALTPKSFANIVRSILNFSFYKINSCLRTNLCKNRKMRYADLREKDKGSVPLTTLCQTDMQTFWYPEPLTEPKNEKKGLQSLDYPSRSSWSPPLAYWVRATAKPEGENYERLKLQSMRSSPDWLQKSCILMLQIWV